jgi:hypothetical protein
MVAAPHKKKKQNDLNKGIYTGVKLGAKQLTISEFNR